MSEIGKWFIRIGGILVILGAFLWLFKDVPLLNKLGKLPGDIRIQNDNFTFYFPLTTSILLSLVLTLILWIIKR